MAKIALRWTGGGRDCMTLTEKQAQARPAQGRRHCQPSKRRPRRENIESERLGGRLRLLLDKPTLRSFDNLHAASQVS